MLSAIFDYCLYICFQTPSIMAHNISGLLANRDIRLVCLWWADWRHSNTWYKLNTKRYKSGCKATRKKQVRLNVLLLLFQ